MMAIRYIQNKQIIQSHIGEEVVMLDIESGYYFGLNSVASVIWNLMSAPVGEDVIVAALMQAYEVSRDTCEQDTQELISVMLDKGIIREVA